MLTVYTANRFFPQTRFTRHYRLELTDNRLRHSRLAPWALSTRPFTSYIVSTGKLDTTYVSCSDKKRKGRARSMAALIVPTGRIDVAPVPCKIYTGPLARCAHGNDRLRPLASRARARLTHKRGHSCSHGPTPRTLKQSLTHSPVLPHAHG